MQYFRTVVSSPISKSSSLWWDGNEISSSNFHSSSLWWDVNKSSPKDYIESTCEDITQHEESNTTLEKHSIELEDWEIASNFVTGKISPSTFMAVSSCLGLTSLPRKEIGGIYGLGKVQGSPSS